MGNNDNPLGTGIVAKTIGNLQLQLLAKERRYGVLCGDGFGRCSQNKESLHQVVSEGEDVGPKEGADRVVQHAVTR